MLPVCAGMERNQSSGLTFCNLLILRLSRFGARPMMGKWSLWLKRCWKKVDSAVRISRAVQLFLQLGQAYVRDSTAGKVRRPHVSMRMGQLGPWGRLGGKRTVNVAADGLSSLKNQSVWFGLARGRARRQCSSRWAFPALCIDQWDTRWLAGGRTAEVETTGELAWGRAYVGAAATGVVFRPNISKSQSSLAWGARTCCSHSRSRRCSFPTSSIDPAK